MSNSVLSKFRTRSRRFVECRRGSAAIEFAITASALILLIVGALQVFIIEQSQAVLETAAEFAGRQILTGSAQVQHLSVQDFHKLVCTSLSMLSCSGVMIDVEDASAFASANTSTPIISYDAQGNVSNQWQYQPGAPSQIVVLRLLYLLPVVSLPGVSFANQPRSKLLLMATSVFKTEQYQ